jgi:hypothetical protein
MAMLATSLLLAGLEYLLRHEYQGELTKHSYPLYNNILITLSVRYQDSRGIAIKIRATWQAAA